MQTVIHIGFPKTATSTLQEVFFPHVPEIGYLADHGTAAGSLEDNARIAGFDVLRKDGIDFDPSAVSAAYAAYLDKLAAAGKRVALLSQERFAAPGAVNWPGDRAVIAGRLHDLFPNAKIFISIRNQRSMLHSQYVNRNAKGMMYRELEDWLHSMFEDPQIGYASEFRYDGLIAAYRALFGAENVHVALFEEFVQERSAYLDALSRFLGIPEERFRALNTENKDSNPSKSARSLHYAKFRNRFFPAVALSSVVPGPVADAVRRFIQGGARAKVEFPDVWQQKIAEYYAPGNTRLASMIGEDRLRRYGYPMQNDGEAAVK
ncbi:sulfotransferase [Rhodospirillaceae bacterium KN72]|uniref:Sulfotransferase n=1 Tax=Pacificispira spongiicola TaxID=2729598 RepID=A0A7Y0HHL0_9PROT|nr:sulfotransferase [Pacificispira spongiicola]NMM45594.1 sulfotransferase [Pacificispira spongiicola]